MRIQFLLGRSSKKRIICILGSRKLFGSFLIFLGLSPNLSAGAENLRKPEDVFPSGETLVYEVRWDPPLWMFFLPTISAGEMTFKFQGQANHNGRPAYKMTAQVISSGFLPKLTGISVQDSFESIVDAQEFCSFQLIKRIREGKRQRDILLSFDGEKGKGRYVVHDVSKKPSAELKNEEMKNLPKCIQDILSAIYFSRLRELKLGEKYPLAIGDDGRVKNVEIRVTNVETVQAVAGKFQALKVETVSVFGGLFKTGGTLIIWVTGDERKIPVKFEAKVKLGKVYGTIKQIGNEISSKTE